MNNEDLIVFTEEKVDESREMAGSVTKLHLQTPADGLLRAVFRQQHRNLLTVLHFRVRVQIFHHDWHGV